MILITGATGSTGSEVVRAVLRRGASARLFVRDADKARRLFGGDVELALGDFGDAGAVRAALTGTDAMLLSCADDPRRVEWETNAIDEAAAAGISRIVRLSTLGATPGAPVAFWDWHGQVDEHLRASNIPSVVLQSSFYMSNLLANADQIATEGKIFAPAGDARIAMIDPCDVGAVAALVLTGAGNAGETYELTGPEAITYAEAAAALADATGRPVEHVDIPDDAARRELVAAGLPEFVADQVVTVFEQLRAGVAEAVTDTFESLTGNPPRSFADFARDHAHVFGRDPVAAAR